MQKSVISWTQETWNSVSGCSKVSDGCKFCYAATLSEKYGWTKKPWTLQNEAENVVIKPHKLLEPYRLKEPTRVFVNSMSDQFHRAIPDWYRAAIFCVMLDLPQHTFQILTKRPEALADWPEEFAAAIISEEFLRFAVGVKDKRVKAALLKPWKSPWPSHIWMGTSVEDSRVVSRIDDLRKCGAAVRFISAEPLIGDLGTVDLTGIHWVICGGESGQHMGENSNRALKEAGERWMQMEWARNLKNQCVDQGAAFFFKQDSGVRTEMRPWLVEPDGTKWRWAQYPGDFVPPLLTSYEGKVTTPVYEDPKYLADHYPLEFRLFNARLAEGIALRDKLPWFVDANAFAAAWWYKAAAALRPAKPNGDPETDAWVHAVNKQAARMDQMYEANAGRMSSTGASPEVVEAAMSKLMEPETEKFKELAKRDTKMAEERLGAILPQRPVGLIKGSKVYATEDIHVAGEIIVKAGTPGIIETGGKNGCNVKFESHRYVVLCMWDMVSAQPPKYKWPEVKPFRVGDKVLVKGSPIVGEITAVGVANSDHVSQARVTRPNPNGGTNMTHWIKYDRLSHAPAAVEAAAAPRPVEPPKPAPLPEIKPVTEPNGQISLFGEDTMRSLKRQPELIP